MSEYPPSDYRRLIEAAARVRRRHRGAARRRGRGRDPRPHREGVHRRGRLGGRAGPRRTRCTASSPSSAARGRRAVPRRAPGERLRARPRGRSRRRARGERRVALQPEQPDGRCRAGRARSRRCSARSRPTRRRAGREPPIVVLDEAYAEFAGRSLADLRFEPPQRRGHPDREQGLRPRRFAGRLRDRPARARSRG